MAILEAILATIQVSNGRVEGRTILQKRMYFLGELAGENFGLSPYYYGPYSSLVGSQLGSLVDAGLVEETVGYMSVLGTFGELKQYGYSLTQDGNAAAAALVDEIEPYVHHAQRVMDDAIASQAQSLSLAAKVHFLSRKGGSRSTKEIVVRAKAVGWDFDDAGVAAVRGYLVQLGLTRPSS